MARVARASPVPVAAGERLTTKAEFAQLLAAGVGIVQPALGRAGGLLEARKIAILAEAAGAQVAPHLYAGPIAWAAAIQLGLSIPNFLLLETIGTMPGFHADLLDPPIAVEDGHVAAPTGPGLGTALDEAVARAHPCEGVRLHLEMQQDPPHPLGDDRFAGG
jgi:galactonate dehydratase